MGNVTRMRYVIGGNPHSLFWQLVDSLPSGEMDSQRCLYLVGVEYVLFSIPSSDDDPQLSHASCIPPHQATLDLQFGKSLLFTQQSQSLPKSMEVQALNRGGVEHGPHKSAKCP